MKTDGKIARQHLSVMQLAETLGSVSEACHQRGMTRTQFHEDLLKLEGRYRALTGTPYSSSFTAASASE